MTKLGTLAALAGTGVLAAAAFVRPPTTPVPKAFAKPAVVAKPTSAAAKTTAKTGSPGFTVTPGASMKGFVVEEIAFAGWGNALGELGRQQAFVARQQRHDAPLAPRDAEATFAQADHDAAGRGEQVADPVQQQVVQRAGAGPPVNHGADVAELGGAPFEFRGRSLRIASRQGRERTQACGSG